MIKHSIQFFFEMHDSSFHGKIRSYSYKMNVSLQLIQSSIMCEICNKIAKKSENRGISQKPRGLAIFSPRGGLVLRGGIFLFRRELFWILGCWDPARNYANSLKIEPLQSLEDASVNFKYLQVFPFSRILAKNSNFYTSRKKKYSFIFPDISSQY